MANLVRFAAFCLKIEAFEGTIGFTSFDTDLVIEGIVYRAQYNIDSFAGTSEINLSVDNGEITQVFDGYEKFSAAQVAAGILSGKRVELRLFDPLALPPLFTDGLPLISGTVGKVDLIEGSYKFEVRSVSELTNKAINFKTSPKCRYDFGDFRCKLNLTSLGYSFASTAITAISGTFGSTISLGVTVNAQFINGTVQVLTGNNAGLTYLIQTVPSSSSITVAGEFAGTFAIGDLLKITAFCAKDQAACQFYNNYPNFGNIPVGGNWMPGLSRIAVTPD